MRRLYLFFAFPLLVGSAEDPVKFFQSCAYASVLPTHSTEAKPEIEFRIESAKGELLPLDHVFRSGEPILISISVSSRRDGYFYIFQDPPDPKVLVFPLKDGKNRKG